MGFNARRSQRVSLTITMKCALKSVKWSFIAQQTLQLWIHLNELFWNSISAGTAIDQGIAYVLMLVALVLTYIIH